MRLLEAFDRDAARHLARATFVPTMGALHDGHAALITHAVRLGGPVVVSIFVNPTQFGPDEDFERYPRTLEDDLAVAERAGADVIWAPAVEEIYPDGIEHARQAAARLPLPRVATAPHLEDRERPGHFAGVCLVVGRLFDLARPRRAVFGEKDWQQCCVVRAMVEDDPARFGELAIETVPTVREPDGLALSSRNRYLSAEERARAVGISRALQCACAAQQPETAETLMRETLATHDIEPEYAVVRDARTLEPVSSLATPTRALIAAPVGRARLLDNFALPVWR